MSIVWPVTVPPSLAVLAFGAQSNFAAGHFKKYYTGFNMKSNWSANKNHLMYSGADFLGFVKPAFGLHGLEYIVWLAKDDQRTRILHMNSLKECVDKVENFFAKPISEQRFIFEARKKDDTKVAHLLIGEPDYGWIERDDIQRVSPDDIKSDSVYDKSVIVCDAFTNVDDAIEVCHKFAQLGFSLYIHHVFRPTIDEPVIDPDEWKKINMFLLNEYEADKIDYEHICCGKDEYSFHDAEELIYGELI